MISRIKKFKKDSPAKWQFVRQTAIITLASALYSGAWTALILPYRIASGGLGGICNIFNYTAGIPVWIPYLIGNVLLFLVGLRALGSKFVVKSLYSLAAITFFLWLGETLLTDPETGKMLRILEDERFMALLLGFSISGLSLASIYAISGSSGGTDIIAMIANRHFDVHIGVSLAVIDFLVISSGLFIPALGSTLERVRYVAFGLCAVGIENITIDYVLNRMQRSVQFLVFTRKHEEVARAVEKATGRTMTLLDGHGWHTGDKMQVVCVLARMNESMEILEAVRGADPAAFISQSRAIGVWGGAFARKKAIAD